MTEQSVGPILDRMGVTVDLDDSDLVEAAVVIAKVVTGDGQVGIVLSDYDGQTWYDQLALVTAAQNLITDHRRDTKGERDDDD